MENRRLENKLITELTILASQCDSTARLGIPQTFALCMDLAGEHADALGNGVRAMMDRGLFWVAVKTKLRFFRRPGLTESVTASTWPEPPGRMRGNRDYLLAAGGETLVAGKTEWTILDIRDGGLRSPREGIYDPALEFCAEECCPASYHRFLGAFDAPPFAEYIVRSTDIDMGGHMNNAQYVRMLAGLFSAAEWNAMDPKEVEVHYRAQCYEGSTLLLQRRTAEDGALELRAAPEGGATVLLARIK